MYCLKLDDKKVILHPKSILATILQKDILILAVNLRLLVYLLITNLLFITKLNLRNRK